MKNLIKFLILISAVFLISSCSSSGVNYSKKEIDNFHHDAFMKRILKRSP